MKKRATILLAAALAVSATSFAATDGSLGVLSTGSVEVSLTGVFVNNGDAQITGLQDFAFGNVNTGDTASLTKNNICVYLSSASTYAIEIVSTNSTRPGQGQLQYRVGPSGADLDYTWAYSAGSVRVTGADGTGLSGSSTVGCSGGTTASLTLSTATLQSSGLYSDTLTLTVSPE